MRKSDQPEIRLGSTLSRREWLVSLSALLVAPRVLAQGGKTAPIKTLFLSHTTIAVSNMARSLELYQKLLGPAIRQGDVALFSFGRGRFFAMSEATGGVAPGYTSYGMAIENFDPDRTKKALEDAGVKEVEIITRGDTKELWVTDPSGIKVQLTDQRYAHGTGPLGNVLPAAPRASTRPPIAARSYSHMTLTSTAPREAIDNFYKGVMGLYVQTHQGRGSEMLGLGTSGPDFLAAGGFPGGAGRPGVKGTVNHCCFTVENFDPAKMMGSLLQNGFTGVETSGQNAPGPMTCWVRLRQQPSNGGGPTAPMGTAELYFVDPDGIRLQVSDVKYCGGSGFFGEICHPPTQ